MEDVRRLARQAGVLQWVADRYRERASRGAPESWSLERQAAALDGLAASLLSLSVGAFTDTSVQLA